VDQLPATWTALCILALVLGARHGIDADHLATIDGLTRCSARTHPALARFCGVLFSLGHGAVVCGVALAAASLTVGWQTPTWLEATGLGVSIAFLFGLAFLNLRAILLTDRSAVVAPVGIRSRLLGRCGKVRGPWSVAAVGALFALSFDTISQATLFALAAARFGGVVGALFVAVLFVLGMLVVDGANGALISGLIRRADRTAVVASRVLALTVAGISLAVGCFAVFRLCLPALDLWTHGREMLFGGAIVAAVLTAFSVGMTMAARRRALAAAGD
jgi:high-affinity nickel-transport protein